MNELVRIFILNFAPAAIPGLFMALVAWAVFGLPRKERPMTEEEIKEALPLITRPAMSLKIYQQLQNQDLQK